MKAIKYGRQGPVLTGLNGKPGSRGVFCKKKEIIN
ncbi:hypothetical protein ABIE26_003333 [Pedobacter africanus]|uniref:Uncharacterized protein n=1 Tax=Pedobacter africanus TaxID=151894 RepID=A0ACC6KZX6_9SPHI|nr:hypothetical protein [Pedobacter africanus]